MAEHNVDWVGVLDQRRLLGWVSEENLNGHEHRPGRPAALRRQRHPRRRPAGGPRRHRGRADPGRRRPGRRPAVPGDAHDRPDRRRPRGLTCAVRRRQGLVHLVGVDLRLHERARPGGRRPPRRHLGRHGRAPAADRHRRGRRLRAVGRPGRDRPALAAHLRPDRRVRRDPLRHPQPGPVRHPVPDHRPDRADGRDRTGQLHAADPGPEHRRRRRRRPGLGQGGGRRHGLPAACAGSSPSTCGWPRRRSWPASASPRSRPSAWSR